MIEIPWYWLPLIAWIILTLWGLITNVEEKELGAVPFIALWGLITLICIGVYGYYFLVFIFNHVKITG